MFNRVRRTVNILLALLLLFLFIAPAAYLKSSSLRMEAQLSDARVALADGAPLEPPLTALYGECSRAAAVYRLFLPHDAVDALLAAAAALVPMRDEEALLSAFAAFSATLGRLCATEYFSLPSLF